MWLESHANLARHPKTRRLMKLLGWSLPDTIGNLHLLWWWALDFAPTGDLTRYTPEELTADLDLLGATPDQFIQAMLASGFLDQDEAGVLSIHDWQEYKRPKPRRASPPRSSTPSSPAQAGHKPQLVEYEPMGSARIDCVEDAARQGEASGRERNQNALRAVRSDSTSALAEPEVTDPSISSALPGPSSGPAEAGNNPELVVPPRRDAETQEPEDAILASQRAALDHLNTQPHKLRPSTDSEVSSQGISSTAPTAETADTEEVESQLTARLRQLPGFAKHWWPLYLDFHKKAGTPLDKNQRARILERFNKDPLTAIDQIKADIKQAVRNAFDERKGILEHAP